MLTWFSSTLFMRRLSTGLLLSVWRKVHEPPSLQFPAAKNRHIGRVWTSVLRTAGCTVGSVVVLNDGASGFHWNGESLQLVIGGSTPSASLSPFSCRNLHDKPNIQLPCWKFLHSTFATSVCWEVTLLWEALFATRKNYLRASVCFDIELLICNYQQRSVRKALNWPCLSQLDFPFPMKWLKPRTPVRGQSMRQPRVYFANRSIITPTLEEESARFHGYWLSPYVCQRIVRFPQETRRWCLWSSWKFHGFVWKVGWSYTALRWTHARDSSKYHIYVTYR